LGERELGPHLTQCGQGRGLPARQVSSWSVQPFGHRARTSQTGQTDWQRTDSIGRTVLQTVAQKLGVSPLFGGAQSNLTRCCLSRGLLPYQVAQVASWSILLFGHNRHQPKIGGAGSPSNTKLSGLRPTSIRSGTLIARGFILVINCWQEVTYFFFPVRKLYRYRNVRCGYYCWNRNEKPEISNKIWLYINMHKIIKYNNKL